MKGMNIFLKKKAVFGSLAVAAICMLNVNDVKAQEFTVQGDIVSSYVWRGMYQGGGAAFQPTLGLGVGNFSVTAWGSTNFNGGKKEVDLTLAYKLGENGPTLSVADLWWGGEYGTADRMNGDGEVRYFNFKSRETQHHFEAGLSYTLPIERFPLSMAWYTMFAGQDKRIDTEGKAKQNYSSYFELNYPFSVKNVDLNVTCGAVPYKAENLYTNGGFAVTNIALKGMTEIKINERFSLPIFAQAIWNPCVEDAFLVFGITLRP